MGNVNLVFYNFFCPRSLIPIPPRYSNRKCNIVCLCDFRCVSGPSMRLRDSASFALRGCLENPRTYSWSTGGKLLSSGRVPNPDQDDGLVQTGRRGTPTHTARVRLERDRSAVLQSRCKFVDGTLKVPFHTIGRLHSTGSKTGI